MVNHLGRFQSCVNHLLLVGRNEHLSICCWNGTRCFWRHSTSRNKLLCLVSERYLCVSFLVLLSLFGCLSSRLVFSVALFCVFFVSFGLRLRTGLNNNFIFFNWFTLFFLNCFFLSLRCTLWLCRSINHIVVHSFNVSHHLRIRVLYALSNLVDVL